MMLGGPIKVSRSKGLHVSQSVCVCAHACMSIFINSPNTLHGLVYVHTVCICVCLSTRMCVCVRTGTRARVLIWCHLFVSGSRHIHVFISVPSGQTWLCCLMKENNVPNNTQIHN